MGLERKLEVRLSTCWPVAVWTLLPWAWFIGASQERQQRCLWKQQQLREKSPALPSRSAASQEDLLLLLECRTTAYSFFHPDLNTEMRLTSALWIPKPPTCWEPCFNNKVPSQPFPTSCRGFHLEVFARVWYGIWDYFFPSRMLANHRSFEGQQFAPAYRTSLHFQFVGAKKGAPKKEFVCVGNQIC